MSSTEHFIYSGTYEHKYPFTTCVELQGAISAEWKKKFSAGMESSPKFHSQHAKWSGLIEGGCKEAGYEHLNHKWEKESYGVKFSDWNKFRVEVEQNTQLMI